MTITVDKTIYDDFRTLCFKNNLKMSQVLNESMKVFVEMAKQKEDEGNDKRND